MGKKKTIYYAHPMGMYNSLFEKNQIKSIQTLYPDFEIINPSESIHQGKSGMDYYLRLVQNVDLVIAEPFFHQNEYSLGAGVALEVDTAIFYKIPVKMVKDNKVFDFDRSLFKELSIQSTIKMNDFFKKELSNG